MTDREKEGARGGPSVRGVRGRGRGTWARGRGKRVRADDAMEEDNDRPPRTRTKPITVLYTNAQSIGGKID